jgi:UDP-sugar pyrophosphorylase
LESGAEAVRKGNNAPGTMSSAESDMYIQNQKKLKFAGVELAVTEGGDRMISMSGIPITEGPRVVLCPAFALTREEVLNKVKGNNNKISPRSSLVLDGHHITIQNLDLDGALVIRAGKDTFVAVDGLKIRNKGWSLIENDPNKKYPEAVSIRGYTMAKVQTAEYLLDEGGSFFIGEDGQVKKVA